MTPDAAAPDTPGAPDPAASPDQVTGPPTGVHRIITPLLARTVILAVIALLGGLELRTLLDRTTPLDGALNLAPWIADPVAVVLIFVGLRGARFIGFRRRPRPLHLKVLMVLTALAFVFYAVGPRYDQRATYTSSNGHHFLQVGPRITEISAGSYWSQVHARDRLAIATNLIIMLALLGAVEARLGAPPDPPPPTRPGPAFPPDEVDHSSPSQVER